jgi:hypothetical protein
MGGKDESHLSLYHNIAMPIMNSLLIYCQVLNGNWSSLEVFYKAFVG